MATHFSFLAWKIPMAEEPGGLPSLGSHRVGHDLIDLAAAEKGFGSLPHMTSVFWKTILGCRENVLNDFAPLCKNVINFSF